MNAPIPYQIQDQNCWLSPQRAIFWENQSTLILSDTHFGKTGHFRKNGIGVPQAVFQEDMQRMVELLSFFKPERMVVVGDLFHSAANLELDLFAKWRRDFDQMELLLVKGNHDILGEQWYQANQIRIQKGLYQIGPFQFVHEPIASTEASDDGFLFSGHLHPGVSLSGMGKQNLHFPCFYFTKTACILPAFSKFSGTATVKKKKDNTIFAIVNHQLIEIDR
jgi:DNA ligase-associated metallophosphoesterase